METTIKEYATLSTIFPNITGQRYQYFNGSHTASVWFTKVLTSYQYPDYQFPTTYNSDTYADSVLERVARKYWNRVILIYDEDDTSATKARKIFDFLCKVYNRLDETHAYYTKMLTLYASQASNLLNQIKTTTDGLNKFNDTPQDQSSTDDDITDDTHLTNITKTSATTSSDGASPMARLKEVEVQYSDMLSRWVDEFSDLFYNIQLLNEEEE